MRGGTQGFVVSVLLIIGAVACATGTTVAPESVAPESEVSAAPASLQRGVSLYARHCVLCHGHSGAGDGPAAAYLVPSPRAFTMGSFNLVSTVNSVPSDDDLLRVLRRGMPGSAMPSWAWLPEADLRQLVAYVRHLAVEGIAGYSRVAAMLRDHPLTEVRAHEMAAAPGGGRGNGCGAIRPAHGAARAALAPA